ncbi:Shg1p KNAG_0C01910 [Huiozyma naganishii CBS 8797]|uniref:BOD1/SHG1 domain-containing protein n=1 Tax=Huiozyma naganishii (strain ATCC MYA-139 / BCRC 22969 / CBS 8797 / KCTC 17520 / NBRC 10181 / NCYC 3082 / Yp74L-3) TaxID=1071383 RepID=J7S4H9_HUIN7|nr:hypothetical protein KNAG_0C01910 [Kazachstania naganishii CBS 8797]CCK69304.1 hypothetical protein KNAG_0C01910 [Kazachstania naganishii CBS 8797]
MPDSIDPAKKLAEKFKQQGYLDQLKRDVLTTPIAMRENASPLEQTIKDLVVEVVKDVVANDEDLIFKNRAATSAQVESQIFKGGYRKLNEVENGINLEEFIQEAIKDPKLIASIKTNLESLVD